MSIDVELPGFGQVEAMGGPSKVTQAGRDTEETLTRQTKPKEGEVEMIEGDPWRTNLEAPQTRGKVSPYPGA